ADRDVPIQAPDGSIPAGDRPPVWRQAPHHSAALDREDRRVPQVRQRLEPVAEQADGNAQRVNEQRAQVSRWSPALGRAFRLSHAFSDLRCYFFAPYRLAFTLIRIGVPTNPNARRI